MISYFAVSLVSVNSTLWFDLITKVDERAITNILRWIQTDKCFKRSEQK